MSKHIFQPTSTKTESSITLIHLKNYQEELISRNKVSLVSTERSQKMKNQKKQNKSVDYHTFSSQKKLEKKH